MCWSLSASATMVAVGSGATVYTFRRGLPSAIWMTLGYFTVMEALQASGYFVRDACDTQTNRLITVLSFLHIVFQPFFINAFSMELLPTQINRRIRGLVYLLCAASSVFMLSQLYPLQWAGTCEVGQVLCGSEWCLRSGEWHIAWDVPYNGLALNLGGLFGKHISFPLFALAYIFASFLLPVLYGAWRFTTFHVFTGPILAAYLTNNVNEAPAIWCVFSIGIILIAVFPILMRQFRVERWFMWPSSWTAEFVHE
jgi:hypothetical protein